MTQVTLDSGKAVTLGELGPTSSLQLMFAKLQLELAETAKSQAMDKMDAISKAQDEQKLVSQLLNEARQAKADAKNGNSSDITTTIIPMTRMARSPDPIRKPRPRGRNTIP